METTTATTGCDGPEARACTLTDGQQSGCTAIWMAYTHGIYSPWEKDPAMRMCAAFEMMRECCDLDREELATRTGLSVETITRIERGGYGEGEGWQPGIRDVLTLTTFFGIHPAWLARLFGLPEGD